MIRVLIFDLGLTLIDARNHPFPHVENALSALASFKTAEGKPLRSCLLSDFTMPTPPVTPAKVSAIFRQYLSILEATGLRPFFEPVNKRVTLSTHAGVLKPDEKLFEKALRRLGAGVPLDQCLFITENADHLKKARRTMGMQGLRFRAAGSNRFDFEDWADAPALIAHLVGPAHLVNTHAAIKAHLAARGVDLLTAAPTKNAGKLKVAGQVWHRLSVPEFADLKDVEVAIPVEGEVTRGARGQFRSKFLTRPSTEQVAEAASFVRSLARHGQIAGQAAKNPRGATHQIETDDQGNRRLVRKRFTAL